jgi:hypothetical protein
VLVFQPSGFQDGVNIDHELGPLVSQAAGSSSGLRSCDSPS